MKEKKLNQTEKSREGEDDLVFTDHLKAINNNKVFTDNSRSHLEIPKSLIKQEDNNTILDWHEYAEPFHLTSRFSSDMSGCNDFIQETKITSNIENKPNIGSFFDHQKVAPTGHVSSPMLQSPLTYDQVGPEHILNSSTPLNLPLHVSSNLPEISGESSFKTLRNLRFSHNEAIEFRNATLNASDAVANMINWQGSNSNLHEFQQELVSYKPNTSISKSPPEYSWKGNDVYQKQKVTRARTCDPHLFNQSGLDYSWAGVGHTPELSQASYANHLFKCQFEVAPSSESKLTFQNPLEGNKDTKLRHRTLS